MKCSTSRDHRYTLHLQNAYRYSVIKKTVTFFLPTCVTFLDKAIVALALISLKKTSAFLWHLSFDKCDNFPYQSAPAAPTSGDCGILKGPFNF